MKHTVASHAPIDLNQLTLFVRVCDSGSFAAVAMAMGQKRSSVSRAIAALEQQLRVQLFSRTTRRVAPTTAGAALYAKVAPSLAALRAAVGSLPEGEQAPSGLLRITAPNDIGAVLLPDLLRGFCQRYPKVQTDVRLTTRPVDMVAEGFDVALRVSVGRLADSSLVARRLANMEMHMFASPGYLAQAPELGVLADLYKHQVIQFHGTRVFAALGLEKLDAFAATDDVMFLHNAIKAGLGVGVLPAFLATQDVALGLLVRVLPAISIASGTLHFVHPPAQHVPRKVTALREYLLDYLTRHPLVPAAPPP